MQNAFPSFAPGQTSVQAGFSTEVPGQGLPLIYIWGNSGLEGGRGASQKHSELRFITPALLYCQFKSDFMHQVAENGLRLNLSSTSSLLYDVG